MSNKTVNQKPKDSAGTRTRPFPSLDPVPEPKWYRMQRPRWSKLGKRGWVFKEPSAMNPDLIGIEMRRGTQVCLAAVSRRNHEFREIHTKLLAACESLACGP